MKTVISFESRTPAEILEGEVRKAYVNTVRNAIKASHGNEFMAGILIQSAIASTYDKTKQDKDLILLSQLTELEYGDMMARICNDVNATLI